MTTNPFEMHSGQPPHVGWWCVSEDGKKWRWWDGVVWSFFISDSYSSEIASQYASYKRELAKQSDIRWCHYWPENARVPRVDPRGLPRVPQRVFINFYNDPHSSTVAHPDKETAIGSASKYAKRIAVEFVEVLK